MGQIKRQRQQNYKTL